MLEIQNNDTSPHIMHPPRTHGPWCFFADENRCQRSSQDAGLTKGPKKTPMFGTSDACGDFGQAPVS